MKNLSLLLATLAGLGACGGGDADPIDAGAFDGAPDDAPTDAAVPGLVTFTYRNTPASGHTVLFLDADGGLIEEAQTNATGVASAEMLSGGSVVLILPVLEGIGGYLGEVYAYTGVRAGASVEFGQRPGPSTSRVITVTAPTYPNASFYEVASRCGTNQSDTISVSLTVSCDSSDVLVSALDAGSNFMATLHLPVRSLASSFTATGSYKVTRNAAVAFTQIPRDMYYVDYGLSVDTSPLGTGLGPSVGGTGYPSEGAFEAAGRVADLANPLALWQLHLYRNGFGYQRMAGREVFDLSLEVDVGEHLLPWTTQFLVDTKSNTAVWSEFGGGREIQGEVVSFQSQHVDGGFTRWNVYAPHDGASLVVPRLPGDFAELNLEPDDYIYPQGALFVGGATFDAFATNPFAGLANPALLPADGSITVSSSGPS